MEDRGKLDATERGKVMNSPRIDTKGLSIDSIKKLSATLLEIHFAIKAEIARVEKETDTRPSNRKAYIATLRAEEEAAVKEI